MRKLFFIGAGKMAGAIAGGIVRAGVFRPEETGAFDINPKAAAEFSAKTGIACAASVREGIDDAEAVLLAIKPQAAVGALAPLTGHFSGKLVISIIAGMTIQRLSELTGTDRIVRVMPNTPALVGAGAAAFAPGPGASAADEELTGRILGAVGTALKVKESDLDAVTALSGSGPAYVFEFIQALADGGVAEGLSRDTAQQLAVQTVLGSARMVQETGFHPAVLKDQVTSPAGTTIRGLEQMASNAFDGTVIAAVRAAAERSRELGKN